MNLVVRFDQPDLGMSSLVGGKGYNLILLTAAGFPVPPGFVVSADAYRLFLDHVTGLDEELSRLDFTNPDFLRTQCTALRKRLEQFSLPEPVTEAIRAALANFPAETSFAVRSSSTFEDLAQAAFAGQHDTYLNVREPGPILAKVRDVLSFALARSSRPLSGASGLYPKGSTHGRGRAVSNRLRPRWRRLFDQPRQRPHRSSGHRRQLWSGRIRRGRRVRHRSLRTGQGHFASGGASPWPQGNHDFGSAGRRCRTSRAGVSRRPILPERDTTSRRGPTHQESGDSLRLAAGHRMGLAR